MVIIKEQNAIYIVYHHRFSLCDHQNHLCTGRIPAYGRHLSRPYSDHANRCGWFSSVCRKQTGHGSIWHVILIILPILSFVITPVYMYLREYENC